MSQNSRGLTPLNWQDLVEEALRRRKDERLTQREHAALANVSIPTMAAFERAETTLTLAKAFDILRVMGLVDEPKSGDAHDRFVQEAFARWKSLADTLPKDSPGRFPHGWFRFDYQLLGELREVSLTEFERLLVRAEFSDTGWPLFLSPTWQGAKTVEIDDFIECRLDPALNRSSERDPSLADFWRASLSGSFVIMRGYAEDGRETFPPGTIFDSALPIWRMAEALSHAERMSKMLRAANDDAIRVRFRANYSGLGGRILRSWSNPQNIGVFDGNAARSDEAILETTVLADTISHQLDNILVPLVSSLYERFGYVGISHQRLVAEIAAKFRDRPR